MKMIDKRFFLLVAFVFLCNMVLFSQTASRQLVLDEEIEESGGKRELHFKQGHFAIMDEGSVIFSENGNLLFSNDRGSICVWNVDTGHELLKIPHYGCYRLLPSGKYITGDCSIHDLYSNKETKCIYSPTYCETMGFLDISCDENFMAICCHDTIYDTKSVYIRILNFSNSQVKTIKLPSGIYGARFSPNARYLAVYNDFVIRIIDLISYQENDIYLITNRDNHISNIAWSPDEMYIGIATWGGTVKIFNTETGNEINSHSDCGIYVSWSSDGMSIATSLSNGSIEIYNAFSWEKLVTITNPFELFGEEFLCVFSWSLNDKYIVCNYTNNYIVIYDTSTGDVIREFSSDKDYGDCEISISPNGKYLASQFLSTDLSNTPVRIWNIQDGTEIQYLEGKRITRGNIWCPNSKDILLINEKEHSFEILDSTTGKMIRKLSARGGRAILSPDGKYVLVVQYYSDSPFEVWSIERNDKITSFEGSRNYQCSAWSPDSKFIAIGYSDLMDSDKNVIKIFDAETGVEINSFLLSSTFGQSCLTYSPDGRYIAVCTDVIMVWDVCSGIKIQISGDVFLGGVSWSPDGKYIVGCNDQGLTKIWDASTGADVKNLGTDIRIGDSRTNVLWSSDGKQIIRGGPDGTIKIWDSISGELLYTIVNGKDGEYLTYTPEGFFTGTDWACHNLVYIVDGLEVTELTQLYDKLYRPDLIAAKMRGEDISEEAAKVDLESFLKTGKPPAVSLGNLPKESSGRELKLELSIKDCGGGIGAVNIALNGKVVKLSDGVPSRTGETKVFRHTVTLQDGENKIEAFAYNSAGIIESLRAEKTVEWHGKSSKPNLYVLTVGINKYRDKSLWLNYAVPDAEAIANGFQNQPSNLYGNVYVQSVLNQDATRDGISNAFTELSSKISADDVFVFYVSGHGTTYDDGDYYYLPVNFRYTNRDDIPKGGVSKSDFVDFLSIIKASKTLVMLDTCNSGAFIQNPTARGMSEKTAIERLNRATGHATLAASSDTQSAMEGYNGHGIFTYVLLDGLRGPADSNGDGYITLTELANYVENEVPELSYDKWGYEQVPQKELKNQDFPIATGDR